jgi:hypothetical protein
MPAGCVGRDSHRGPVVALVSSAGGLDALTRVLSRLPVGFRRPSLRCSITIHSVSADLSCCWTAPVRCPPPTPAIARRCGRRASSWPRVAITC